MANYNLVYMGDTWIAKEKDSSVINYTGEFVLNEVQIIGPLNFTITAPDLKAVVLNTVQPSGIYGLTNAFHFVLLSVRGDKLTAKRVKVGWIDNRGFDAATSTARAKLRRKAGSAARASVGK